MAEDDQGQDIPQRDPARSAPDDAWSAISRPDDDSLIPRELWSPAQRRASEWHAPTDGRPRRKTAQIGGRDAHLTFEPPTRYGSRPQTQRAGADRPRAVQSGAADKPAMVTPVVRQQASPGAGARSLAPRDTVVGYRRSTAPSKALLALLAIVLLAAAGYGVFRFLTRPAALALKAMPSDATVTIDGRGTRTGAFSLAGLEPQELTVVVARSGFETATVTIDIARGDNVDRTIALVPLPFAIGFTSRPKGAAVTITAADGSVLSGTTPCSITAPAGPVTISMVATGTNTFTQKVFIEATRTVDVLLDPKGQLVHALGSLTAKGAPKSVSVTPDGKEAWAAILNGPPSIEIYDLKTMRKTGGVDIGKYGAVEVIFNKAGTRAYASQMETAKVFEIDTATRAVLRSFKTESAWTKVVTLSPDEKTLYAANWSGNDVSVISLTDGQLVKRIPVAKTPRGLWATGDGKYLYVAGFDAGDLERIDLTTWGIKKLFHSGGAMRHLVADEKTGKLYASDMAKDVIWVTDMVTLKTTQFCKTDEKPNTIELSPDGRILFVSNRGENNPVSYYIPGYEWGTVLLIGTADAKPLDAIVGGNQCTALDVSADGHTLVFSDFLDDRLRVYDIPAFDVLAKGGGGRFAAHFADLKKGRP